MCAFEEEVLGLELLLEVALVPALWIKWSV